MRDRDVTMEVETLQVESFKDAPDLGYFFTTAGVLKLSAEAGASRSAPGSARAVAVADKYGVLAYTDQKGASQPALTLAEAGPHLLGSHGLNIRLAPHAQAST